MKVSDAAEKRTKECLDRTEERGTMSVAEEGQHEQAATTERQHEWTKTPNQRSSSIGTGVTDRNRKAEAENPREHENRLQKGYDEETRRRKTVRFFTKMEQEEKHNMASEIMDVDVNEQEVDRRG